MVITAPRVNRESTAIRNTRIGVQPVYEGSRAAQAAQQGFQQISSRFFQWAEQDAREGAQELAASMPRNEIVGIDPETGEPLAFSNLSGLGRVASSAYRRVITARYQQSIEEDMRNRGAILAEQHRNDPQGFTEVFGNYIDSMAQHAGGQWRGFVENAGASYLARTQTAMTIQQMRASRASLAAATRRASEEATASLNMTARTYGLEAFTSPGSVPAASSGGSGFVGEVTLSSQSGPEGSVAFEGDAPPSFSFVGGETSDLALAVGDFMMPTEELVVQEGSPAGEIIVSSHVGSQDAVEAAVVDESWLAQQGPAQRTAISQGILWNWAQGLDPNSSEDRTRLEIVNGAFKSHNPYRAAMVMGEEYLPVFSHLFANEAAADDFGSYAGEILGPMDTMFGDVQAANQEAAAQSAELFRNRSEARAPFIANDSAYVVRNMPAGQVSFFVDEIVRRQAHERQVVIPGELEDDLRAGDLAILNAELAGVERGLLERLTRGRTTEEIDNFQEAIANDEIQFTGEEGALIRGIRSLARLDGEVRNRANTFLGSAASNEGANVSEREREAHTIQLDAARPEVMRQIANAPIDQLDGFIQSLEAQTANLNVLSSDRDSILSQARENIMSRYGNQAMLYAESTEEVTAIESALKFPNQATAQMLLDAGLDPRSVSMIEAYRNVGAQAGGQPTMERIAGNVTPAYRNTWTAIEQNREESSLVYRSIAGLGDASTADGRRYAQTGAELMYDRTLEVLREELDAFGGGPIPYPSEMPSDFWTSRAYQQDPRFEPLRQMLNTQGFMPEGLHSALERLANGSVFAQEGYDPAVVADYWRNVRTMEQDGLVVTNPSVLSLSVDERARLDVLSEAYYTFGEEGFVRAQQNIEALDADWTPAWLPEGENIESWMVRNVDGYSELAPEQRANMRIIASYLSVSPGGIGAGRMQNSLQSNLNETYAPTGGYVRTYGASGRLIARTAHPLSTVTHNRADEFIQYARQNIIAYSDIEPVFEQDDQAVLNESGMQYGPDAINTEWITFLEDMGPVGDGQNRVYAVRQMTRDGLRVRPVMNTSYEVNGEYEELWISTAEEPFVSRTEALRERRVKVQMTLGMVRERMGEALRSNARNAGNLVFPDMLETLQ